MITSDPFIVDARQYPLMILQYLTYFPTIPIIASTMTIHSRLFFSLLINYCLQLTYPLPPLVLLLKLLYVAAITIGSDIFTHHHQIPPATLTITQLIIMYCVTVIITVGVTTQPTTMWLNSQ